MIEVPCHEIFATKMSPNSTICFVVSLALGNSGIPIIDPKFSQKYLGLVGLLRQYFVNIIVFISYIVATELGQGSRREYLSGGARNSIKL